MSTYKSVTMMSSGVHCLRTPVQALRHMQAVIICRSRQSIKPSSEILQTVPDLFEIFRETQPLRSSHQRRSRKLHWALLPRGLNLLGRSPVGQNAAICANYSTSVQTLPESAGSEVNCVSHSKEATVVNQGQELKLHHKNNGERCATSSFNSQAHVPLSLGIVLADLQSNPDSVATRDRVQGLVNEIERRKQRGTPIPEYINPLDLEYLLSLQSQSGRRKFLNFLWKKERMKHRRATEQAARLKLRTEESALKQPELTVRNTIIRHGQSLAEDVANSWSSARSLMFGPPIVFDLSYDAHMNRREVINTVLQLGLILKLNKTLKEPFHIHFTSVAPGGCTERELKRVHGGHYDNLMVSITDKRPQQVFRNDQLVCLTADSPNVLSTFDPFKIYIIGGFVDRSVKGGISLGKAEAAGLAHARLPLDENLRWHKSTKNLTLDQMMSILSEMKVSGDWSRALQHVPRRKHLGSKIWLENAVNCSSMQS